MEAVDDTDVAESRAQSGFPASPGSSETLATGLFSPWSHSVASRPGVSDFVSG